MTQQTKTEHKQTTKKERQRYSPRTYWHDLKEDFDQLFDDTMPETIDEAAEWWERYFKPKAWDLLNQAVHASFKNGRMMGGRKK